MVSRSACKFDWASRKESFQANSSYVKPPQTQLPANLGAKIYNQRPGSFNPGHLVKIRETSSLTDPTQPLQTLNEVSPHFVNAGVFEQ